MTLSTLAAGLAIVAFTALMELTNRECEEKREDRKNSK